MEILLEKILDEKRFIAMLRCSKTPRPGQKILIDENKQLYRKRQQIVEHPYGTIKRQWGFNYIITKKYIERAEADFGFIMTVYNLRRIINIVGMKRLREYMVSIFSVLCSIFDRFKLFLSLINQILRLTMKNPKILNTILNIPDSYLIKSFQIGF